MNSQELHQQTLTFLLFHKSLYLQCFATTIPVTAVAVICHRGETFAPPRWRLHVTAVTGQFSLYQTEIICSANLQNRRLLKYHDFRVVRVLTSGFLCCNFAKEIRRKPPLKARERDAFMKLKFQSAQPISHRPPLWGGFKHRGMDTLPKK